MNEKQVEEKCEEVENDDIASLANTLFYYASVWGSGFALKKEEIVLSLMFAQEDMVIHLLSLNEISQEVIDELRQKAKELAKEKQKNLEASGFMDVVKKMKNEIKLAVDKKKKVLS